MGAAATRVRRGQDRLAGTCLRVLLLVLGAGRSPTYRELARRLGVTVGAIHAHLLRLRSLGLVAWESDRVGTLKATCEFRIAPHPSC
jgi:predicted transcriptional regulator